MKVSFVVVSFGDPKPLRTCLSSLLDQTYPASELQIIVVDNTPIMEEANKNKELCLSLDPRIRYEWTADRTNIEYLRVRHTHCLYTATEIGAKFAIGEWIGFPNGDTYVCRAYVERMLAQAEKENLEFVYSDIVLGRHDHRPYVMRSCTAASCNIDKSNFLMKRSWFTGFRKKAEYYELADGLMVDDLVEKGIKHGSIHELLVTHN